MTDALGQDALQAMLADCARVSAQLRATKDSAALEASTDRLRKLVIKTSPVYPPIPLRNFDWTAIDDATYCGEGSPQGFGATEQEAIDDLLEQLGIKV